MIDFTTVSREFRSLVSRRRELLTFIASLFAAMGLFLQHVMQGNLPQSLKGIETHAFATYAVLLMIPSLILSLRIAKLHGGMTLNGILYARLMQEQAFVPSPEPSPSGGRGGDLRRAAKHNWFGVSFLMFLLVDLIAGFSAAILALALALELWAASLLGAGVCLVWFLQYVRFHDRAAEFALKKIETDACSPFDRNEWEAHLAGSLQDTNHDMITVIAFVGLIVFSVFESLSSLGQVRGQLDLAPEDVQKYGPLAYGLLMLVTCVMGLVIYIRLRIAVGRFSLQLDPTDQPFRPFRLTDSLLGYLLLAFLFAVSVHVLSFPTLSNWPVALLGADVGAFLVAVAAEQLAVIVAGRQTGRRNGRRNGRQTGPQSASKPKPAAPGAANEGAVA